MYRWSSRPSLLPISIHSHSRAPSLRHTLGTSGVCGDGVQNGPPYESDSDVVCVYNFMAPHTNMVLERLVGNALATVFVVVVGQFYCKDSQVVYVILPCCVVEIFPASASRTMRSTCAHPSVKLLASVCRFLRYSHTENRVFCSRVSRGLKLRPSANWNTLRADGSDGRTRIGQLLRWLGAIYRKS